jgi:hypothetical protein
VRLVRLGYSGARGGAMRTTRNQVRPFKCPPGPGDNRATATGSIPCGTGRPGHLTQEQAQKKAEGLTRRAQRLGLRKKYVVISTCTMGLVVAERCKL